VTDTDLFTAEDRSSQTAATVNPESPAAPAASGGSGGSLSSMVLPELRALASSVGVKGTSGMRKSDLIELASAVLPAGVLNAVSGDDRGVNIGAAMAAHPGIDKIVFTGSTATGRHVMRSAADTLKRLTLELGGNDAGIVLPDADPAAIAEGLFWGAFLNNGQTCAAMKRLYVHDSLHDAVCDALVAYAEKIPVGDGLPAVIRQQEDVRERHVAECVGAGPPDRARHVGDAVMDDPVHDVRRLAMGRGPAGHAH